MSSKHTPTPWSVVIDTDSDGHPTGFARVFPQDAHWSDEYFNVEDAERIVACVNACEGLADPSVVPELLAALKDVVNQNKAFVQMLAPNHRSELSSDPLSLACNRAEAIIAKAEGTE